MDQRSHHVGHETHALLVGEGRNHQGPVGLYTAQVQPPHQFQPGHDTVHAVVPPAGRHRVDMRTGHHRCGIRQTGTGPEDVADLVHLNGQVQLLHPGDQLIPSLTVGIGQGYPAHTSFGCCADPAMPLDAVEQRSLRNAMLVQPLRLAGLYCGGGIADQRRVDAGGRGAFGIDQQHVRLRTQAQLPRHLG